MKEITRIHLAKTAYDIETAAKQDLAAYLADIERMMGSDEAMYEIEARMVELLAERDVASGGVVTAADVAALRSQMGDPREFSEEGATSAPSEPEAAPTKRLMRDADRAWLGGVCAGLAAYWGIRPLWVRLLFIISPFVTVGVALLIYIILWVGLPRAQTAADRLQMRGQPVTLDSLKQSAAQAAPATRRTLLVAVQVGLFALLSLLVVGSLAGLALGGIFGSQLVLDLVGFAAAGWVTATGVAAGLGLVLLVVVFGLLAYAVVRWRMPRRLGVSLAIMGVASLLLLSTAVALASISYREATREIERRTTTDTIAAPQVAAAKRLVVRHANPSSGIHHRLRPLDITYVVDGGTPRLETQQLDGTSTDTPPARLTQQGDTATLELTTNNPCNHRTLGACSVRAITVYGPALDEIKAEHADLTYRQTGRQDQLAIQVSNQAEVAVTGTVDTVRATAEADESEVSVRSAAVQRLEATVRSGGSIEAGLVDTAVITADDHCTMRGRGQVEIEGAREVTLNGQPYTPGSDRGRLACVEIDDRHT